MGLIFIGGVSLPSRDIPKNIFIFWISPCIFQIVFNCFTKKEGFPKKKTLEVQVDYFLNGFSVKTIVLVGIYNQHFKGTILFMVGLTSREKVRSFSVSNPTVGWWMDPLCWKNPDDEFSGVGLEREAAFLGGEDDSRPSNGSDFF